MLKDFVINQKQEVQQQVNKLLQQFWPHLKAFLESQEPKHIPEVQAKEDSDSEMEEDGEVYNHMSQSERLI